MWPLRGRGGELRLEGGVHGFVAIGGCLVPQDIEHGRWRQSRRGLHLVPRLVGQPGDALRRGKLLLLVGVAGCWGGSGARPGLIVLLMAQRRATCRRVYHQHLLLLVEAIAAGLHGCRAAALRVPMMAVLLLLLLIALMLLEVVLISWQLLPVLLRLI